MEEDTSLIQSSNNYAWSGKGDNLENIAFIEDFYILNATIVKLKFETKYKILNEDLGEVQISPAGGTSWHTLGKLSGSQSAWVDLTYDVSPWAGQWTNLRFVYMTNGGSTSDGWSLDNIFAVEGGINRLIENFEKYPPGSHWGDWTIVSGGAGGNYVPGEAIVGFYGPLPVVVQNKPEVIRSKYGLTIKDVNTDLCAVLYSNVDDTKFTALQNDENVKYVSRNYYGKLTVDPNDPRWGDQWGPARIDAHHAWDLTTGSSDVKVAVIDTGIDYTHPDLGGGFGSGFRVIGGYDWYNDDGGTDSDPMDGYSHGTHCAGIIGATGNNNIGITGMNWQVSLLAEKVLDSHGSGTAWTIAQGMTDAVNKDADVLSISLGIADPDGYISQACTYANSQDRVTVVAAGNEDRLVWEYPASYSDRVITVSGIDENDDRYWNSNFGSEISVAAPAVNVLSTILNNDYGLKTGTSMACPHVSGVTALMLARDPSLSNTEIRCILEETADDQIGDPLDPDWGQYYGHGLVNASEAVTAASYGFSIDIEAPLTQKIRRSGEGGAVTFTVKVDSLHDMGTVTLDLDTQHYDIDPLDYSFTPENGVGDFESTLTIWCPAADYPFTDKITHVIGTVDIPGITCDLTRFSNQFITITSNTLSTDDMIWIQTSTSDTGVTDPERLGRLHTSPWIKCNNDPPNKGGAGNILTITYGKLPGFEDVDSGPIMIQPYFNEFTRAVPVRDWPHLDAREVSLPAGKAQDKESWYWEIPEAWGEHVCVFAQVWRPGIPQEDWDPEFNIGDNNNIAQHNFFHLKTSSPCTSTLTFENPTGKQMNMKIYAEVPNENWAVDLCQPAKLENGKVVTPLIIPPNTQKDVTLTIIPDEAQPAGEVTISYEIEGYEEMYDDMFVFTFMVLPSGDTPPYPPDTPVGPVSGEPGQEYTYSTVTIDPDALDMLVFYFWDWGDGTTSGWLGPFYENGEQEATHTWATKGNYNIVVKAKDEHGAESDWSDPLAIIMPYSYTKQLPLFFERLFQRYHHAFPLLRDKLEY